MKVCFAVSGFVVVVVFFVVVVVLIEFLASQQHASISYLRDGTDQTIARAATLT